MRLLHRRPIRLIGATILAVLVVLPSAAGAFAKVPDFTVETSPADPRPNEPIVVTVRTWADGAHLIPASSDDAGLRASLDDLLVVRRAGSPDRPIHLVEVDPNLFAATITLPAGDWTLVAFPDRSGWSTPAVPAGYPDMLPLAVREEGPSVPALLLGVTGLLAIVLLGRWLRTRRPERVTPAHAERR
jgi:hypothetical protein